MSREVEISQPERRFAVDQYGRREELVTPVPPPPLSDHEVRRLFAYAVANDNREHSDAALLVWREHADSGRWTYEEAIAAMRRHYRDAPGEWLMPGRITQLVVQSRNEAWDRAQAEASRVVDPDAAARVLRVADELAAALGGQWTSIADEVAMDPRGRHVPCDGDGKSPGCGAAVGESCQLGGQPQGSRSARPRRTPAGFVHPSRLDAEARWLGQRRAERDGTATQ